MWGKSKLTVPITVACRIAKESRNGEYSEGHCGFFLNSSSSHKICKIEIISENFLRQWEREIFSKNTVFEINIGMEVNENNIEDLYCVCNSISKCFFQALEIEFWFCPNLIWEEEPRWQLLEWASSLQQIWLNLTPPKFHPWTRKKNWTSSSKLTGTHKPNKAENRGGSNPTSPPQRQLLMWVIDPQSQHHFHLLKR